LLRIERPGKSDLERLYSELRGVLEGPRWHGPLRSSKVVLVGDTHGAPEVSLHALRLWERTGGLLVFMGDYVDRGYRGLENLYLLLRAKLEWRREIYILRGNHESRMMNHWYGFLDELDSKGAADLYPRILDFYGLMPYMARVNEWFVVHGGIACSRCGQGEEQPLTFEEIVGGLPGDPESHREEPPTPVAMQLVWNDPRPMRYWFAPSTRGTGIYYYGILAIERFLRDNGFNLIIRAHERSDALRIQFPDGRIVEGFGDNSVFREEELRGSVLTVFSSRYHGAGTGILVYDSGEFTLHRVEERLG